MTPSDVIDHVAIISFDDDIPDSGDRTRILKYVNLANDQIFAKVSQIGSNFLSTSTMLALTSSSVLLPTDHYKTIKVVDTTNSNILDAKQIEEIEDLNPALDNVGTPEYYYIEGGNLKVFPLSDVSVRMRYTPVITPLTDSVIEADIIYPRPFHRALVEGALYYMFEDERDVRVVGEITRSAVRFREALASLVEYYKGESRQPLNVKLQDF